MARTPTARLMDGTGPARRIIATSSATAAEIHRRTGTAPCLATVLVGEDPASVTYVRMKRARCEKAGILVAAVGRPRFLTGADIKPGAVVIDAGYNPGNAGDVDFESARDRAGLITPVPGGVGPMTIAVLLAQTVEAATRRLGVPRL
ncbi:hypothetical protein GCM10010433_28090 [Streptomyces pulveraceus]|uniref:methenyltetrahydrofolate cyclohydrolase n=1 Tax=Streptomyces pulveraceus TaxID=68258 RepID=A0ABW1GM21_9ACTN